jgi:DNA replication factor GINS
MKEEAEKLDKKSLKANLLGHELRNVEHLVTELTRKRYKKLVKTIRENQKIPSEVLTAEEAKICTGFLGFTQAYRTFAKSLLQGQAAKVEVVVPEMQGQPHRLVTLRFIKAIPAIVGSDMKTYGPFMAEDVASVPVENARILVKQGLAATVEVS